MMESFKPCTGVLGAHSAVSGQVRGFQCTDGAQLMSPAPHLQHPWCLVSSLSCFSYCSPVLIPHVSNAMSPWLGCALPLPVTEMEKKTPAAPGTHPAAQQL